MGHLHSLTGKEELMPKLQFYEKLLYVRLDHQFQIPESTDVTSWGLLSFPGFPSFMKSHVIDDNSQEFLTSCLILCSPGLDWGLSLGTLLEQHQNILNSN